MFVVPKKHIIRVLSNKLKIILGCTYSESYSETLEKFRRNSDSIPFSSTSVIRFLDFSRHSPVLASCQQQSKNVVRFLKSCLRLFIPYLPMCNIHRKKLTWSNSSILLTVIQTMVTSVIMQHFHIISSTILNYNATTY